jgi:TRAP-type C4-dicarboxylate transport system permease small subunit
VNVDFVLEYLPRIFKKIIVVFTRLLGMAFFLLLGWNLFALGTNLYSKEEVSLTLHVPIYPVAYILGFCAFAEFFVLLSHLIKTVGEVDHE